MRNQTSVLPIRRLRPKTQFSHVFEQKSSNKFRLYFMINHNQMANIFVLIRNVQATGTPIGGVLSHCAISQTIQFKRSPCVYIYLCFLSLNRQVTSTRWNVKSTSGKIWLIILHDLEMWEFWAKMSEIYICNKVRFHETTSANVWCFGKSNR